MPRHAITGKVGSSFTTPGKRGYFKIVGLSGTGRAIVKHVTPLSYNQNQVRYYEREIVERAGDYLKLGKSYGGKTWVENYEFVGASKVDKGFQAFTNHLQADGLSKETLALLREKWDSLSTQEKGQVWNEYRSIAEAGSFGSDTFDFSATMEMGAEDYASILSDVIDNVMSDW